MKPRFDSLLVMSYVVLLLGLMISVIRYDPEIAIGKGVISVMIHDPFVSLTVSERGIKFYKE